jgi:hypothetical protein
MAIHTWRTFFAFASELVAETASQYLCTQKVEGRKDYLLHGHAQLGRVGHGGGGCVMLWGEEVSGGKKRWLNTGDGRECGEGRGLKR